MPYLHEPTPGPAPIEMVAEKLGLEASQFEPVGRFKAKLNPPDQSLPQRGKLILVTSMTPTRSGSGKTVTTVGLGQAFGRMGLSHCICLREPSLGPTLGIKGGGAGGGKAQLVPMEDINLHFTGDLHAVTSAHNLLSAMVDNQVHHDNALAVDPQGIHWPRVLDLCDRQLRHVQLGGGSPGDGFPHPGRFDITAASEVMAVLALAQDPQDLRIRLERMSVARGLNGEDLHAGRFGAVGAMTALLRDAMRPNLVQTLEKTPALVHCGPFANIAHGCSSTVATRTALGLADYVVTEAGFGADLGAEKFFHIKCRQAGLKPAAAVVVLTMAALRKHGGAEKGALQRPDADAVERGLQNLAVHLENLVRHRVPAVVTLNCFPSDTAEELARIRDFCEARGVVFAPSQAFARGGEGALLLAEAVRHVADQSEAALDFLYPEDAPLAEKIETLATQVYRADGVDYEQGARQELERLQADGHGVLPVCMAKTPYSLSDRPALRGVPQGWRLKVREVSLRAGAGFVVVLTGSTVTMPGMPRHSAAEGIFLDDEGEIQGVS